MNSNKDHTWLCFPTDLYLQLLSAAWIRSWTAINGSGGIQIVKWLEKNTRCVRLLKNSDFAQVLWKDQDGHLDCGWFFLGPSKLPFCSHHFMAGIYGKSFLHSMWLYVILAGQQPWNITKLLKILTDLRAILCCGIAQLLSHRIAGTLDILDEKASKMHSML